MQLNDLNLKQNQNKHEILPQKCLIQSLAFHSHYLDEWLVQVLHQQ